ncbi:hypothetical protein DFH09DRAFT_457936 [Mycena vulgaris]|nr:hypothetical protein DFH09DRAFT_457936 [Mycena vulgaris]
MNGMNTFSAFRFATRTLTLLRPRPADFPCLNPLALHPRVQVRFKKKRVEVPTRPRNEKILHEDVSLVVEDNTLVKMSLKDLLSSINNKTHWVELVDVSTKHGPVVKIIDKKQALAWQKDVKARRRVSTRRNLRKEVQLTWSSEKSDLEHKIARVRSYLEIGARVDVVFSTKPNTDPPAAKVMQQKLQDTAEMMADVSTEERPVEWRRNFAVIHLRGIVDPNRKLTPEQVQLVADEAVAAEDAAEGEEDEAEGDEAEEDEPEAKEAKPMPPPPPPPPPPAIPGKAKGYIDLSEYGFQPPPARKNPLSGQKAQKQYGKRRPKPT